MVIERGVPLNRYAPPEYILIVILLIHFLTFFL